MSAMHLIMMEREIEVIVLAALLIAIWQYATSRLDTKIGLALWSIGVGAAFLASLVVGANLFQYAKLTRLRGDLEIVAWFPNQEAYRERFPDRHEAIERFTIDPRKCPAEKLEATIEVVGQKLSRQLDRLGGRPRPIYSAAALCRSQY